MGQTASTLSPRCTTAELSEILRSVESRGGTATSRAKWAALREAVERELVDGELIYAIKVMPRFILFWWTT